MPNPQHEQVVRISSEVAGQFPLWLFGVDNNTKYLVDHELPVECLGLYKNDGVAIFGEWHGTEDNKPEVPAEDIKMCDKAFLVMSTTAQEARQSGCSKTVVCLRMSVGAFPATERVFFSTTNHVGFYNPVV